MIKVSAPGKLMILGEHAVVYGEPCIVTAVNQRLSIIIDRSPSVMSVDAPQVKETKFVDAAIDNFFKGPGKGISGRSFKLSTTSEFSQKFGFGSSSAVTVGVFKALSLYFNIPLDNREIFNLAYQTVLDVQGVGSGFDIAAATFGGTLYFVKGGKTVEPLPDNLPLVVGFSGVKADTTTLIKQVADLKNKYPEKVGRIFTAIGKLVNDGRGAITEKDWERVGKIMDFNQDYLRDLGVSTEKLETLISVAKKAGAYGAKLSGAGGGDCMIALHSVQGKPAVVKAIQEAGGEVIEVTPNASGVKIEL